LWYGYDVVGLKMAIICLPSEVFEREFDAKVLLATELVSRYAHNAIIGYDKVFNTFLPYSNGAILMDKSASSIIHKGRIEPVVRSGGIAIVSDEEGFNNLGIRGRKTFLSRISAEAVESIDLYACWGEKDYIFYRDVPGFLKKAKILGNCRSDLLGPIGKRYYSTLSQSLREVYGPYVLASDSFAIEKLGIQGLPSYNISSNKQQEINEEYLQWLNTAKQLRAYFTQNIRHAATALPNVQFVVRPHPAARPEWWHRELGDLRNVHIIFKHSPESWIHGALAVMTMGCTIGVQAMVAKKPALELVSSNLPTYGSAPQLVTEHVCSPDDLVKQLRYILGKKFVQDISIDKLDQLWTNTRCSSVSVFAAHINDLCNMRSPKSSLDMLNHAKSVALSTPKWPSFLSMESLISRFKYAQFALGTNVALRIRKIANNAWMIEKGD